MKTTRRKMLGMIGLGGAAALAGPAALATGAVASGQGAATAFRFQCFCGESVVAAVPVKNDSPVSVNCPVCHHGYNLRWHGDHFSFSDSWVKANSEEPEPAGPMFVDRVGFERQPVKEAMAALKGRAFKPGSDFEIDPPTPRARR